MTDLPRANRVQHWPAFDGVRAISLLVIIAFHANYPTFLSGGFAAVDVFFVLSGFLITWLLVNEHDRYGAISYSKFYARRALRLFPALAAVIVGVVILVLAYHSLAPYRPLTLHGLPYVILYVGNWDIAFGSVLTLGLLGITWTLAIEEQFYLLWPLVLNKLLRRMDRRRIARFLILTAVAEMLLRAAIYLFFPGHWIVAQYSTVTHSDGLLLGSALALMWTCRDEWKHWDVIEKHGDFLGVAAVAGWALVFFAGHQGFHQVFIWTTLSVLATVTLLVHLLLRPKSWISYVLEIRPLQWIGKRSYGCYLWHLSVIAVLDTISIPGGHPHFERFVLDLAGTFVIAAISYRLVELPFLNRKVRFARVREEPAPATG
ncbi:MAG TPA: acyltransferase [Acidimicrobiales bacterium]|nr:acyltransferase [Acidimicrobiales bacterium]